MPYTCPKEQFEENCSLENFTTCFFSGVSGKTQTSCKEGRTELSKLRSTCTYYVRLFWGKLFLQHFSFFIIIFSFWVEDLNFCLTILWSFTEMRSTSPKNPSYGLLFSEDFCSHLFLDIEFKKKIEKKFFYQFWILNLNPQILETNCPLGCLNCFLSVRRNIMRKLFLEQIFCFQSFFWVFCQN